MVMAYTKEQIEVTFNAICKLIENGSSLRGALSDEDMPSSQTFFIWVDEDEEKSKQYTRACESRSEAIFEDIIEIADNPVEGVVIETDDNGRTKEKKGDMLGHRKLQVDTRKWMLSKLNPKKYGDKLGLEHSGGINEVKVITDNPEITNKLLDKLDEE